MNPEQIRAALANASELNDAFYKTLSPVLENWMTVANSALGALPQGTTKDVRGVEEHAQAGTEAVTRLIDSSIYLGLALDALAVQF